MFAKISLRFFVAMLLAFSLVMSAYAESGFKEAKDEIKAKMQATSATDCQSTVVKLDDIELFEFLTFLDTHFSNKSSNSSLTNIAIVRFSDFKNALEANMSAMPPAAGEINDAGEYASQISAYKSCQVITDAYIDLGKQRMITKIKNATAQKKTTIMLEKYQAINKEMRDLNFKIAKMYGYFMAFKNKLPGFVEDCVTS